jgi:hypothetical protein
LAQAESLASMCRMLNEIPELERRILALHFAADMTHQEIAADLEIPRRTISYKIESSLKRLRDGLVGLGLASVAPLIMQDINNALCSGITPPTYLQSKVLECIARAKEIPSPEPATPAASAPGALQFFSFVLLTVALLAGGTWLASPVATFNNESARTDLVIDSTMADADVTAKAITADTNTTPSRSTSMMQATAAPSPIKAKGDASIYRKWTFENGPAEDLQVVWGEWKWSNDPKAKLFNGAMTTPIHPGLVVVGLPTSICSDRFLITVKLRARQPGKFAFSSCLLQHKELLRAHHWHRTKTLSAEELRRTSVAEVYYMAGHVVHLTDNEPYAIDVVDQNKLPDRVLLAFGGYHVEEIELRSLDEDEIPAEMHHPEILTAAPSEKDWTPWVRHTRD